MQSLDKWGVLVALCSWLAALPVTAEPTVSAYPTLQASDQSVLPKTVRALDAMGDRETQLMAPFKIFDNLYYIGIKSVSCYLLVTTDGLILLDALFADYPADAASNIKSLGFDPREIKYVLGTHGHFDHVGGFNYFQENYGARLGMTAADWQRAAVDADNKVFPFSMVVPPPDLVLADGDTLTLGEQEIRFYVTPGHTEGVLSMEFTVRDGDAQYRAFMFGGAGLNFTGVWRTKTYLNSVRRLQTRALGSPKIEVNVTNHPWSGQVFERYERLSQRAAGDPHSFVDAPAFHNFLSELLVKAEHKLREEYRERGVR